MKFNGSWIASPIKLRTPRNDTLYATSLRGTKQSRKKTKNKLHILLININSNYELRGGGSVHITTQTHPLSSIFPALSWFVR